MKRYIGTKIVHAEPMNRLAYNLFRGWELPVNECGTDPGYLVEYTDGGQANTHSHAGYVSWSPQEQFEKAYKLTDGMSFGLAVDALKKGAAIVRHGWNGKGMYLFMIQGSNKLASIHGYGFGELINEPMFRDAIFMKTVDNELVPWTASQSDVLATDWSVV